MYRPELIEHLVRPRNVGELSEPDGFGESGHAACGDVVRFTVRISNGTVAAVGYKAYGCAPCIAAGSAMTELVQGESIIRAAAISREDLRRALGGELPEGKEHALTLVLDALHRAFEDYWNREAEEADLVEGYRG